MIFDRITEISDNIKIKLNMFKDSGFVFWDKYDFEKTGMSDKYQNMFYIRLGSSDSSQYTLSDYTDVREIKNIEVDLVFVAMIDKKYLAAEVLEIIVGTLLNEDGVSVTGFSPDKQVVINAEHGIEDKVLREHNAIIINFDLEYQYGFDDCLTITEC
jgi:hypothetical protein